ncbi:MAG: non-hydrolyzing UDP-N-acetylglucosamine 2-epimerase [Flavobacteriales bacterium]
MKNILFLFGTRPEAIKLAPVIIEFKKRKHCTIKIGVTAQHREMLDQVLSFFEIVPDYDLNIMVPKQDLAQLTANLIDKITTDILLKEQFDLVVVQGDSTSAMAGALAAFYQKIKVVHVEAGLRSGNFQAPFPEEMNRVMTSKIAEYHFCPTAENAQNLYEENISKNVFVVGNTVVDALKYGKEKLENMNQHMFHEYFKGIDFSKKIILFTCHRRENFGQAFIQICYAINEIAKHNKNFEIVFPLHLNPNVKENAHQYLKEKNIKIIDPLAYHHMIWLMTQSYFILTDSGGLQEEAACLNKPVLVLPEVTERTEGVNVGIAKLVGYNTQKIVQETQKLIDDENHYKAMIRSENPYGNGDSSAQIANRLFA